MSLTKDDLAAIKKLIDGSIDERVPAIIDERVPAIINERVPTIVQKIISAEVEKAVDEIKQHVAAGFEEIHERVIRVEGKVDAIAQVQQAELERVDYHDRTLTRMRKMLRGV